MARTSPRGAIRSITRIAMIGGATMALVASIGAAPAAAQTPASPAPAPASPSTASAALAALGISVSPDGWITYTNPRAASLPLTHVKVQTVNGSRTTDGGCTVGGSAPRGNVVTYSEQVAFNPRTCQSRVLSGNLTQATAAALMGAASTAGASTGTAGPASTAVGRSGTSGITPATTSYQSAHTTTQWIDPLNITITQQAINLKWPLYGAGGTLTSSWPSYAFPYDGWTTYGPYFSGFNSISGGWWVGANSHFVNYDFAALVYAVLGLSGWLACGALLTTRADFYHNVQVYGYTNNTASYWWNDSVSGACSNLVHHAALTGFGWWS